MSEAPCKVGDRIRLINMPDDPHPIPAGTEGTVLSADPSAFRRSGEWQISVKWDAPRSLSLIWPVDSFEVIE